MLHVQFNVLYVLYSMHTILCIVCYAFYSMYCNLCILFIAIFILYMDSIIFIQGIAFYVFQLTLKLVVDGPTDRQTDRPTLVTYRDAIAAKNNKYKYLYLYISISLYLYISISLYGR